MVDSVGIDEHMSNITILKILTLVPSTALTMCFIEPLSSQYEAVASWLTKN